MITLKELIINIFGEYTPITYDVLDDAGNVLYTAVADGMAGVDWPYVLGVLAWIVTLYCFLRILGGALSRV